MKLSTRARHALDELQAVRDECEKASTELVSYTPKDPARDVYFRQSAGLYETAAELIGRSLDDFIGMTTLLAAEEAEREADAEEPAHEPYRGTVGRKEMVDA